MKLPIPIRVQSKVTLHKAAIFSMIAFMCKLLVGPLSILLIATKLSLATQAIYYTFLSISAIQWVFELGVSTALVHHLSTLDKNSTKFKNIVQLGGVFYTVISLALFGIMFFYAQWVFTNTNSDEWQSAWLFYSIFICLNIANNFILIVEEGKMNPTKVYFTQLISSLAYSLTLLLSLFVGAQLYSLGIAQVFLLLSTMYLMKKEYLSLITTCLKFSKHAIYHSAKEVFNFQYKLSLVWITGYLYWNFYTIYFYKYVNADFAGKYGATNAVIGAISLAMLAFLQTKRSLLSNLVSDAKIQNTFPILRESFIYSIIGYVVLSGLFIFFLFTLFHFLTPRFLDLFYIISIIILRLVIMLHEFILIYLRTFKDEPLYKWSIFNYLLTPFLVIAIYHLNLERYIFLIIATTQVIFLLKYIQLSKNYVIGKIKEDHL